MTTTLPNFTVVKADVQTTVYDVKYKMDQARIHDVQPFVAGKVTAINDSDVETSMVVTMTYDDSRSYSFSRSAPVTGEAVRFKANVLDITEQGVEVSFYVDYTSQWGDTTTVKKSVMITATGLVPPKSAVTFSYVGTVGTCDVPFTYTQEDLSLTDGSITKTEGVDGMFRGVNSYNFKLELDNVKSL